MERFVLIGCGYTGTRLARRLPGPVRAFTGSREAAAALAATGLAAESWDLDRGPVPIEVTGAIVFHLAPPPPGGATDPRTRALLSSLSGLPVRVVYMSTTGVYGDAQGRTVDEETLPAPSTDRARARVDAERSLRDWCEAHGVGWTILRVPGIYGPGRLPLERLRRGDPVLEEDAAGPGNRIHVDDLVSACLAAATLPAAANRIYNIGDGNHASTNEYFATVARLAGLPGPPTVTAAEARIRLSPVAYSYLAESRRVDTRRMREELGLTLRYADLAAGIEASLRATGP